MQFKILCLVVCFLVVKVYGHTMIYKVNDKHNLEPDFVPVSSTVIPLPIYQVGYGINVAPSNRGSQRTYTKPEGPVTLLTVKSKNKKPLPVEKEKNDPHPSKQKELPNDTER
ncbi:uncharacterized protein LOC108738844 [Agrilus planipennis]|uniref:Uncharacterized protein LOC108738844 n=1 Tax=Agrilus planipennis TaxID=224129 RepID=A0A7F5R2M1_AGRPL|nr:uncharacterized protein LOC108738844 [Agrilus planipennis]